MRKAVLISTLLIASLPNEAWSQAFLGLFQSSKANIDVPEYEERFFSAPSNYYRIRVLCDSNYLNRYGVEIARAHRDFLKDSSDSLKFSFAISNGNSSLLSVTVFEARPSESGDIPNVKTDCSKGGNGSGLIAPATPASRLTMGYEYRSKSSPSPLPGAAIESIKLFVFPFVGSSIEALLLRGMGIAKDVNSFSTTYNITNSSGQSLTNSFGLDGNYKKIIISLKPDYRSINISFEPIRHMAYIAESGDRTITNARELSKFIANGLNQEIQNLDDTGGNAVPVDVFRAKACSKLNNAMDTAASLTDVDRAYFSLLILSRFAQFRTPGTITECFNRDISTIRLITLFSTDPILIKYKGFI